MRPVPFLAAAACLVTAQPALTVAARAAEPVLERVLLSTGGVGYLGYRAVLKGDGGLRLNVPLTQVDDILKSLTILGDGGAVRAVSLLGPTPLADLFRDVPFGEDDLSDLPTLLTRLRGAEIEVRGPSTLRGRILTVATEQTEIGDRTITTHRLSLLGTDGVRSLVLEDADGITFTDPALERQIALVLARLADGRGEQQRELAIGVGGVPGSTVRLGYLAEMPLWKASFRLVAREDSGLLQGWAILENASGQDWQDVDVTLIAGSPRALRQALFQSIYVQRPEVPVTGGEPSVPRAYAAKSAPSAAAMDLAEAAPAALAVGTPQELTAQTLFHLPQPVSLATGHTVMAPIVDHTVPIERIALYRAAEGGPHPSAALRLRNATGASLPAGLATLYEELPGGGLTYLGDAPLPQLPPDAEELLPYGRDGNVDVTVRTSRDGRVERARIADGVLELVRLEQQRFDYSVTARFAGATRSFVLEQALPDEWHVAEPTDARVDAGAIRVARTLASGSTLELAVSLERPVQQRLQLVDVDPEQLLLEFAGREPSAGLRDVLGRLQALSSRVATLQRRIDAATERQTEIVQDQARLRANLEAVPRGGDLAARFLAQLAASEDELTKLGRDQAALRTELEQAAADRAAFIRTIKL